MTPLIDYPDPAVLYRAPADEYGTKTAVYLTDIDTNFTTSVNNQRGQNVEDITADALAYLDVDNVTIANEGYDLEGCFFAINRFGRTIWYTIDTIEVNQRKLLDNAIDNIQARLVKTVEPEVES